MERKLQLSIEQSVQVETLRDDSLVLGQSRQNFLYELRVLEDLTERQVFAIGSRLCGLDQIGASIRQSDFELVGNGLETSVYRRVKLVEKLERLEVVLSEKRHHAPILAVQKLSLVLREHFFLEHVEQLAIEVGPAEALVKACLFCFQ